MSTVDDVGKVCTLEVPYGPFPVNWKPPHFMEGVTGCGRHSSICGPCLSVCLPLPFLTSLSSLWSPLGWASTRLARLRPPHFFLRPLKVKEVGGQIPLFFFLFFLMYLFICFAIHSVDKLPVLILLCKLVLLLALKYIHECVLPLECN